MQPQQLAIPGAIVIAGVLVAGAIILSGGDSTLPSAQRPTAATQPPPSTAPADITYELDGFASLGDPNAPVTIVEYSDFACPFCKRFAEEIKPRILETYIETGDVYFVRKDFIAVGGDKAAEAAHCAGDQNAYWEYHDLLMANQSEDRASWSDPAIHRSYAVELGLDADALVACFEAGTYTDRIIASTQEGARNGGSGTPYFIINDTPLSGAQPFGAFSQVIEAELAKAE